MAKTKHNKKLSITSFERIMKETYVPTKVVEWNGVEITITPTLSFKEMMSFVDGVVKSCFTTDNGSYLPEVKDFVIKCFALETYANFAMPKNVERKYELIYCTDAVNVVMANINITQFEEIITAIDTKIDNIIQANIEAINKQINELYSVFSNLQNQFSNIFAGVGSDEINKLVEVITDGKFDESKLVQTYIETQNTELDKKDGEE